jgi:hypothetical protein
MAGGCLQSRCKRLQTVPVASAFTRENGVDDFVWLASWNTPDKCSRHPRADITVVR